MSGEGSSKAYKKRVIVENSSDESEPEELPPLKRVKAELETLPTSNGSNAPRANIIAPSVVPPSKNETDSDAPLSKKSPQKPKSKGKENGNKNSTTPGSEDDDAPLTKSPKPVKSKKVTTAKESKAKKVKPESDVEMAESDEEKPKKATKKVKAPAKPKVTPKSKAKKKNGDGDDEEGVVAPKHKVQEPKAKPKVEGVDGSPIKGEEGEGEDGEEVYRWWDQEEGDGTKWNTLVHNGVLFPPEYEAHGVKMNYAGHSVILASEAEEVCSFYAALLGTDYPKNETFVKNFFKSWLDVLNDHPCPDGTIIKNFADCDFTPIHAYLEAEKDKRKSRATAEKKLEKAAKDLIDEPFKTCLLDGRKEKVGNFRLEPPGLFRGRGAHPKTGLLKTRLSAEQVTINIGKDCPIPQPPPGSQWHDVIHDNTVTWLATWKENINGAVKYVFLAPGSSLKGQSDFKKFEKARALKEHIDRIRSDYTKDLKDKEMATRQRATAIYFIDRFALRNGNEKGEDEADTVGCCSLRIEHVTLTAPTTVTFDFLGKDSIRYLNSVEVDLQVFKNLKIFKKEPKVVGDLLFDRLNTGQVNKYLTEFMPGLTAKVFRTYNASQTFKEQLLITDQNSSIPDKILAYNRANRMVAVLCNHQKSVSKTHGANMDKALDKIRGVKYSRMKLRKALFASDKTHAKLYPQYADMESDLDEEWIDQYQITLYEQEIEKITKKFEKENKKLSESAEPILPPSELKTRLKAAEELKATLKLEYDDDWESTNLSTAKILTAIEKIDVRITAQKIALTDKDEGKEVSLGTSKMNYLDPRITFAWCKKFDVPPSKIFPKTLIEKFTWAAEVEADFSW